MSRQSQVELKDRREAVLSLLRREEPAAAIARRYQISDETGSDCTPCHSFVLFGVGWN